MMEVRLLQSAKLQGPGQRKMVAGGMTKEMEYICRMAGTGSMEIMMEMQNAIILMQTAGWQKIV